MPEGFPEEKEILLPKYVGRTGENTQDVKDLPYKPDDLILIPPEPMFKKQGAVTGICHLVV